MNFVNHHIQPLPLLLPTAQAEPRRQQIAGLRLADAAMLAFNYDLHGVHAQAPMVDADQMVSLARWLQSLPPKTAEATISLRMARAQSLRRMLADPAWPLPTDVARRGQRLLEYICRIDDLIPDDLPLFGHLDDALLVELSWSEFADQVQDYLDYCRFCLESSARGTADELRTAWESDCLAEANALLHRQHVNERGYARPIRLSQPFRVC